MRRALVLALLAAITVVSPAQAGIIGGSPHGCPRVSFCGCALAVKLFGHARRDLWPARAWYKFARATPAPGTVAVRAHHVFQLIEHVDGSIWVVYDPNSGHHKTRIHERSIAGYRIVDPRRG